MIKTLSFYKETETEVTVGNEYYFGALWDGSGEGMEYLERGNIVMLDDSEQEKLIEFEVTKRCTTEESDDLKAMESIVKVTDIYNC